MKALIVDDEMLARKRIKSLLSEVPAVAEVEFPFVRLISHH